MNRIARVCFIVTVTVVLILGLCLCASATELKTGIGTVQTDGLRLRAKPNTDAEIMAHAMNGDHVVIIRQIDDWYLVDYNLEIGYMSVDYLAFDDPKNIDLGYGEVNTSTVNMRSAPSSDGDLLTQLTLGEKAYIIGFNSDWYKVQYDGLTGYIRSDLLDLTQPPAGNSNGVLTTVADQLISYASQYMGTPYVWGGTTPSGFDCSGFTKYCYKAFGVDLLRTAAQQMGNGYKVTKDQLIPGDLVFFANTYASYEAATHVGIYIGGGKFLHAASGGVKITALSDAYYASRYVGARRVL